MIRKLGHAFRAVFWSFFGVRKNAHYAADVEGLKPALVIVAAVISAAVFVLVLLVVVRLVTR